MTTLWPLFLCVILGGTVIPLLTMAWERMVLRKSSAAAKHRLWTITAACLLVFPMLALVPLSVPLPSFWNENKVDDNPKVAAIKVAADVPGGRSAIADWNLSMRNENKVGRLPPGGDVGDSRLDLPGDVDDSQLVLPVRSTARRLSERGDLPLSGDLPLLGDLPFIMVSIWLIGIVWFGVRWLWTHACAAVFLWRCHQRCNWQADYQT